MAEQATTKDTAAAQRNAAKILRYFGIGLYVFGALTALAFFFMAAGEVALKVAGKTVDAEILDTRTDTYRVARSRYGGSSGTILQTEMRTDYFITIRFDAGGEMLEQERPVSKYFFDDIVRGQTTPVRFLPVYPQLNTVDPQRGFWGLVISGPMAAFLLGCGFLFHRLGKKLAAPNPKQT